MRRTISQVCICASLLAGCASVGPSTVVRDRFDYVTAISDSWKRQTLLNLLKVRYADAPVFMDVGTVINAYSLEGDISLGGQYGPPGAGNTWGAAAATGRYSDKPTITYQPLSGDRFARNVMAALPVTAILYLIQSGYPADIVLRICVSSINGLENAYGGPGNPRAGDPKFRELMTALREAQEREGTGFRIKTTKDGQTVVMYFRSSKREGVEGAGGIRELLGLDATAREFDVVSGSFPERNTEIAILTPSILQIEHGHVRAGADHVRSRVWKQQQVAGARVVDRAVVEPDLGLALLDRIEGSALEFCNPYPVGAVAHRAEVDRALEAHLVHHIGQKIERPRRLRSVFQRERRRFGLRCAFRNG